MRGRPPGRKTLGGKHARGPQAYTCDSAVALAPLMGWRRHLQKRPKMREFLRVFPGWKLRPRRSAQERPSGRVCPRIPCLAPGQESFGRYCVRPRAPSYARKIPASEFQAQEGHRRPAAAPPPCRCPGIRPALAAPGGATVRPGGPQRLRRAVGCLGIYPVPTARRGGKSFPCFFPLRDS